MDMYDTLHESFCSKTYYNYHVLISTGGQALNNRLLEEHPHHRRFPFDGANY